MTRKLRLFGAAVASLALIAAGCGNSGDNLSQSSPAKINVPATIPFDLTQLGSSQTKTLEILNAGEGPLRIDNLKIVEKDDTKEFVEKNEEKWNASPTVAPGETYTVKIAYQPEDRVKEDARVVIESNAPRPEVTVSLEATGFEPDLDAPSRLNFSSVQPGQKDWQLLSVQNLGSAPLDLNQIQIAGEEPDKFEATFPQPGLYRTENDRDARVNLPHKDYDPNGRIWPVDEIDTSLAPGEELKIRVWFRPEDPDGDTATLKLFSNDTSVGSSEEGTEGVFTIDLTGNSGSPCLALSHPKKVDFKQAGINNLTKQTVTANNCRPESQDLKIKNVELLDDAGGVFGLKESSLPGDLPDQTYTINGTNKINFLVTFKPPKKKEYAGKLLVESNDPSRERHVIDLEGAGSENQCPKAEAAARVRGNTRKVENVNTGPLKTVEFFGDGSSDPDGNVKRYEWTLLDAPKDSSAAFSPSSNVENPKLWLDLAGTYEAELVVYDDDGAANCGDRATVTVKATPQEDIHIQLVWDTPKDGDQTDDDGADLDLHYRHPKGEWNEKPWDIFWWNRSADWGEQDNKSDDPSLDLDDTNGAGPENLNHNNPSKNTPYGIGVHYFEPNGFGASYATVRVFLEGTLAKEFQNKYLPEAGDFWYVGDIQWNENNKTVIKQDKMTDGFP